MLILTTHCHADNQLDAHESDDEEDVESYSWDNVNGGDPGDGRPLPPPVGARKPQVSSQLSN
jgi:hypothetical protein